MSMQVKKGFSLTEVLMAAGILVIGFMMIAMVYPVGIKLATSATERTIGVVVAKEAEAKLRTYAYYPGTIDFGKFRTDPNEVMLFEDITGDEDEFFMKIKEEYLRVIDPASEYYWVDEMIYPSLDYYDRDIDIDDSRYHWSALCGDIGNGKDVEVLILVTRKASKKATFAEAVSDYADPDYGYWWGTSWAGFWPSPVRVELERIDQWNWWFDTNTVPLNFMDEGFIVIDANYNPAEGIRVYQIVSKNDNEIELDGLLQPAANAGNTVPVWVVPPAIRSSRSPLVGVYPAGVISF